MSGAPGGLAPIVGRNGAQLFFCFAGSALLNVVSQAFFARAVADEKDAWLSGTLLAGTLASALGVPAALRFGLPGRPLVAGLGLVAGAGALFGGAFFLRSAVAFAGLSIALRFLMQYGTQELDRRAVLLSGEGSRRANDIVGLGMRFAGMLLGPLWFGLVRDSRAASLIVIALLTALGAWTARLVAPAPGLPASLARARAGEATGGTTDGTTGGAARLDAGARLLLWGSRAIYAAYYLLASSIIYVLSDLHHVPSPVSRGGMIVTVVYASAIVATVVEMARGRTARRSPLEIVPATLLMMVVGAALPLAAVESAWVEAAGGVCLGVAFARFQLAFRDRATYEAIYRDNPALLAAYNNLGTTSALVGYAAMTALVGASRLVHVPYASIVGAGVAALGAVAIPLVVASALRARDDRPAAP